MKASWQPSADIEILRRRAELLGRVREFFAKCGVLEVETPLMSHGTVTDPHIISIMANFKELGSAQEKTLYLQTSPEYAMKRLLAAGMGPIYQITKAFRQGEVGRLHNPEFTMLEWYRPGFDHHALMDEMDEFLQEVLTVGVAERATVVQIFEKYLNVNPHRTSVEELINCAKQQGIQIHHFSASAENPRFWLDLLFSHCIEPHLGQQTIPLFLYDFPVSQAALARIRQDDPPVASRFEVYFKGIELANGFHELKDSLEQRKRFEHDLKCRSQNNIESVAIDERFISALAHGLPDCAGVALGVDRLMMLALGCETIAEVVSFAFERA